MMRMVPPQRGNATKLEMRSHLLMRRERRSQQQLEADGQQAGAAAVGEEAEVADANEAAWKQMQQEAPQELVNGQASSVSSCCHARNRASGR